MRQPPLRLSSRLPILNACLHKYQATSATRDLRGAAGLSRSSPTQLIL